MSRRLTVDQAGTKIDEDDRRHIPEPPYFIQMTFAPFMSALQKSRLLFPILFIAPHHSHPAIRLASFHRVRGSPRAA